MKRLILYILILVLSLTVPEYRTDVAKLIPVEVIFLYEEEGIVIETDTGNVGCGSTLGEAIDHMKETASGEIFLDTAEYLLVTDERLLNGVGEYLKGTVRVCMAEKGLDLEDAAGYLEVHKPSAKLRKSEMGPIEEILTEIDGQLQIKREKTEITVDKQNQL